MNALMRTRRASLEVKTKRRKNHRKMKMKAMNNPLPNLNPFNPMIPLIKRHNFSKI